MKNHRSYQIFPLLAALLVLLTLTTCKNPKSPLLVEPGLDLPEVFFDLDPIDCLPYFSTWGYTYRCRFHTVRDKDASWSPDGKYIAYIAHHPDSTIYQAFFIHDISTGRDHILSMPPLAFLSMTAQAWSPDSRWVVVTVNRELYKIRYDGKEVIQLTSGHWDEFPIWGPSGEIIFNRLGVGFFSLQDDGTMLSSGVPNLSFSWTERSLLIGLIYAQIQSHRHVVMYNENTREITDTIYTFTGGIDDQTWVKKILKSPSTDNFMFIAPIRYDDADEPYFTSQVFKLLDGEKIPLTEYGGDYARWSPDGRQILYVNTFIKEGNGRLWLMDADGSNKRPLRPPRD